MQHYIISFQVEICGTLYIHVEYFGPSEQTNYVGLFCIRRSKASHSSVAIIYLLRIFVGGEIIKEWPCPIYNVVPFLQVSSERPF